MIDTHMKLISLTNSDLFENNETEQVLKVVRNDNLSNLNVYLNFNLVRNKFANLQTIINGNADIVPTAETKLDVSFLTSQFTLEEYNTPYHLDINKWWYTYICKIFNSIALPFL